LFYKAKSDSLVPPYICILIAAMKRYNIFMLFLFLAAAQAAAAQDWKDEKYIDIDVLGWKVKVNTKLLEGDTSVLKKSLGLFGKELNDILHVLPPRSIIILRSVPFWFEKETTTHGYTGEYWPPSSREYLIQHGGNPNKAGGIEIVAGKYIDAKAVMEDWVILHELAHAYHLLTIQYDGKIKTAYKVIRNAGLYANVRRGLDMNHHGYALTNYKEYFAEITTMYFGHNSYYPFDRFDLKHYDPIGYKLVQDVWEVNEK
jgi:hypothetical protein